MTIHSLSPLDGRYENETAPLRDFFSEFAYLRTRARLELDFLSALSETGLVRPLSSSERAALDAFSDDDARKIQQYEKITKHDVKAIEYVIREKLPSELHPWIHFGLTSEDINNIVQGVALHDSREKVLLPALDKLIDSLREFAKAPRINWISFSEKFIRNLGLEPNVITTQILPYDNWARYFQSLYLINSLLIGYAQDMWRYISEGYIKQALMEGEVGSSTMPQKVNPIYFENAEGNLGIANALLTHYTQKLPVSRLQRDLSDSTVRRTFGVAFGHTLLAWINLTRGMSRIEADKEKIKSDLDSHWEVVSEGAQTVLRAAGRSNAYESLKSQTRGRVLDESNYRHWAESLEVDDATRARLLELSPESYIGMAVQLVDKVLRESKIGNGDS